MLAPVSGRQPVAGANTPIEPVGAATQQFANNPAGLSPPTGGAKPTNATFTRGSDKQVATAKDMARAAGAKR